MSIVFAAKDKQGSEYAIGVQKTGIDSAIIRVNNNTYNVSNLRKNALGTEVTGTYSWFLGTLTVSLQVSCDPREPTFILTSGSNSNTYYFLVFGECVRFLTWINNDSIPIAI